MTEIEIKRSNDRYLGGVCGGIAEWFHLNPWLVRIVWTLLSIITFIIPGLIIYVILWKTMEKPDE